MNKIGKIAVLVVLGMFVAIMLSPSVAADGQVITDGGNADGEVISIGTADVNDVSFIRNSVEFMRLENGVAVFNENSGDIDFRIEGNGDANLFFVDAGNDNVGIGTASPSHKLEISDSDTTANRAGLKVAQSGAITGTGYGLYVSKTGASTTNVGGYFSASEATNNYGLIIENGYVGIGTTSPDAELVVMGDVKIDGHLGADNGHFYVDDTNHKVGINTDTPDRKLDIEDDTTIPQLRLTNFDDFYVDFHATGIGDLAIYPSNDKVGIDTATPVTTLDVNGGLATQIYQPTSYHYTIDSGTIFDHTLICDVGNGVLIRDVDLPDASTCIGRILVIKKVAGTNTLRIDAATGDSIEGVGAYTVLTGNSYMIQSFDNNNWYIIADF